MPLRAIGSVVLHQLRIYLEGKISGCSCSSLPWELPLMRNWLQVA